MTPDASQRTAFEKNTGAYSVPVVNAEFLYVKNNSHFFYNILVPEIRLILTIKIYHEKVVFSIDILNNASIT